MLGENEYFIPFINMLHSSDYRNRIFVLNIIDDIPNHKKEILNHLMKQQREEVISHIKQKIQEKLAADGKKAEKITARQKELEDELRLIGQALEVYER